MRFEIVSKIAQILILTELVVTGIFASQVLPIVPSLGQVLATGFSVALFVLFTYAAFFLGPPILRHVIVRLAMVVGVTTLISLLLAGTVNYKFFGLSAEVSTGSAVFVFLTSLLVGARFLVEYKRQMCTVLPCVISFVNVLTLLLVVLEKVSPSMSLYNVIGISAAGVAIVTALHIDAYGLKTVQSKLHFLCFTGAVVTLVVLPYLIPLLVAFVGIVVVYIISSISVTENVSQQHSPKPAALLLAILTLVLLITGVQTTIFTDRSLDAELTLQSTYTVAKSFMVQGGLEVYIGSGPDTFLEIWTQYQPKSFNVTPYWSAEFRNGSSFVVTHAVTTGLAGIVSWLVLILALGWFATKQLFLLLEPHALDDFVHKIFSVLAILLSLLTLCVTTPSLFVVLCTGMLLGVFSYNISRKDSVDIKHSKTIIVVLYVMIAALVALSVGVLIHTLKVYNAASLYESGRTDFLATHIYSAQDFITQAITQREYPLFFRTLSQIQQDEITLLLQSDKDVSSGRIVELLAIATKNAEQAATLQPEGYLHWMVLGNVQYLYAQLKVGGASEAGLLAFSEAQSRAPQHPAIDNMRSRIALVSDDPQKALDFVYLSLDKKYNYSPALATKKYLTEEVGLTEKPRQCSL